MSKTYNLFINHSLWYDDKYQRLIHLINKEDISYKNYSFPKADPTHNANNDKELYAASIVIILASVYATYIKWINKEIKIAKRFDKTIIVVEY
ncbi:hypothetical protein GKZ28_08480 [Clostridium chromiireducens]|uniref:Thoeris protein ThsB TIR-like domain-containing protein n=1 Tax=Clostridium chromiireducens TaxID=225345 RepID=A0A964W214_9CLOT|nr:hypothetical protein [Clostridium chromiireducens]